MIAPFEHMLRARPRMNDGVSDVASTSADESPLPVRRAWRTTALLSWAPVFLAMAYLVLFVVKLPKLIERVYWDSDAATATVIAETAGDGTVVLERFGWFTSLWFAVLTRPLPFHRELWEIAPYLFSLVSVALLAWASWRLAGSWAAGLTAAVAVSTSPFVSYGLVTLNFHTATWVSTVVLAAYSLWLTHRRAVRYMALSAALVSVLAGTTLASDHLFAFVGLIPFGLTGLLLLAFPGMRLQGSLVVVSAVAALPIARLTTRAMSAEHVDVYAVPQQFAAADDLWPNFGRMLRLVVQLVNGDYFFDAPLSARSVLSLACAVLVLLALAAPFLLLRRELRSAMPSVPLLSYAFFWGACITFNCASFVLSSEGTHPGFYFVPVLYATAATVPLLLSGTPSRRLLAGLGGAVIVTVSITNLAENRPQLVGGGLTRLPPVAAIADEVVDIAKKERAPYGYADYWDASSLTWSTDLAVRVRPVVQCALPQSRAMCVFWFNVNSAWYRPRPARSFVLRNSSSSGLSREPPSTLGPPRATYELGDGFTLYVYPYDVASRLDYSSAPWDREE